MIGRPGQRLQFVPELTTQAAALHPDTSAARAFASANIAATALQISFSRRGVMPDMLVSQATPDDDGQDSRQANESPDRSIPGRMECPAGIEPTAVWRK